jgi:hypothetical protein
VYSRAVMFALALNDLVTGEMASTRRSDGQTAFVAVTALSLYRSLAPAILASAWTPRSVREALDHLILFSAPKFYGDIRPASNNDFSSTCSTVRRSLPACFCEP